MTSSGNKLADDPMIIEAFKWNKANLGRTMDADSDMSQDVAQVLSGHDITDRFAISAALLTNVNPLIFDFLQASFGRDGARLVGLLHEANMAKSADDGVALIPQLSQPVKAVLVAAACVNVRDIIQTHVSEGEETTFSLKDVLDGYKMNVYHPLRYSTGSERLEDALGYILQQGYNIIGVAPGFIDAPTSPPPGNDNDGGRFEDTAILRKPFLRHAYDFLLSTFEVRQEHLEAAIRTAEILSTVPEKKDQNVIAAALFDIALPDRTPKDMDKIMERFGSGVTNIIKDRSYHKFFDITRKPPEMDQPFTQVMIAGISQVVTFMRGVLENAIRDEGEGNSVMESHRDVVQYVLQAVHERLEPSMALANSQNLRDHLEQGIHDLIALAELQSPVIKQPTEQENRERAQAAVRRHYPKR